MIWGPSGVGKRHFVKGGLISESFHFGSNLQFFLPNHYSLLGKGQTISKANYGLLNSPKKPDIMTGT